MKASIFLRIYNFSVVCCYLTLLVLSVLGIIFPFYKVWFSFSLIFLSFILFPRFILYNINTNIWFGSLLFLSGAFGVLRFSLNFDVLQSLIGYLLCLSFSSLVMFVLFRQFFHFKTFTIFVMFAIILLVYKLGYMQFWLVATLSTLLVGAIIALTLKTILLNLRKI